MKLFTLSPLRLLTLALISTLLLSTLGACSYDKLYAPCSPPATVSYKTDIWPILKANCRDACHNPTAAMYYKDFNMDDTQQVQFWATHKLDKAPVGATDFSALVGNIRHEPGYNNMPQVGAKLDDCQIALIEAWVKAGSLNN